MPELKIQVILNNNKQSYQAKIIGNRSFNRFGIIKNNVFNLPHIVLGNSDWFRLGNGFWP